MRGVKVICTQCGGEDIENDALVEWSKTAQQWVIKSLLTGTYCVTCEEDVNTKRKIDK